MAFPINSSSGLKTNSRAVIYKIDLENGFSLQGEIGTISNNYEEEYSYFRGNNKLRNKDFSNLNLDYGPSMYLLTAVGIDFVKKCKRE